MDNQNTYCTTTTTTTTTTNFLQPLVLQSQVIGDYHLVDHEDEKAETSRRFTMFDTNVRYRSHQNPRKKRSKLLRISDIHSLRIRSTTPTTSGLITTKPKCAKKPPDPNAPKITRPCTECGKKFWSWKALFGHMRCHPQRQWRGINPPPNLKRQIPSSFSQQSYNSDEDHETAECLLLLANGPNDDRLENFHQLVMDEGVEVIESGTPSSGLNYNFECSSCKRVFGSHQALGGHRATHKNVRGCFANTKTIGEDGRIMCPLKQGDSEDIMTNDNKRLMVLGHKCSICLRVFSSGQALGGHKRCHWEKLGDETTTTTTIIIATRAVVANVNPKEHENNVTDNLDLNVTISR